jgi:hypothetical protein
MLKLEDFAVSTNTAPAPVLACGPTVAAYASVGLAVAQGHFGGGERRLLAGAIHDRWLAARTNYEVLHPFQQ